MSEKKTAWKLHMFVSGILVMIMVVVGWVVYDDWGVERITQSDHVMPVHDVGNLLQDDLVVEQTFSASYEELTSVTFWPHLTEGSQGWLTVEILQQGRTIASGDISTTELQDYVPYVWTCNALLIPDELVVLRFSAAQKAEGYLSIFYGDTADVAGRFQVAANGLDGLTVSGTPLQGRVTFDISGAVRHEQVMYVYGIGMVVLLLGANLLLWWGFIRQKTSRISKELRRFAYTLKKYSFLLQQLVARNFNTKYRQSVLGVLWSVLNPLLTAAVLYFVFSTLFKTSTENYIAFLYCGIVVWNCFVEAVNLGLEAVTGSVSIINKVYVPKYIFPVSQVLSAMINLLFALIPLFIICMITGVPVTKTYFLLLFGIGLLFMFSCGMSLIMATSNVFYRDTKFLWSVLSTMWMYLTPVFYTESIIPAAYISIYRMNPMYQILTFFRSILIQGVSPQPLECLYALAATVIPLLIGIWIFRSQQNKFVLYL